MKPDGIDARMPRQYETLRPSDRAIAEAFNETVPFTAAADEYRQRVWDRARELDAARPEGGEAPVAWQVRHMTAREPPHDWTPWTDCPKWEHDSIVQNRLPHTQARALYTHPPVESAQEGFVLVPREPTEAMELAGRKVLCEKADKMETAKLTASSVIDFWQQVGHHPAGDIYRAMLASAQDGGA